MFVSALSNNCNFGTCIPVMRVYYTDKNGDVGDVPDDKIPGVTTALVKRLKNMDSKEASFFRSNIDSFSSSMEKNDEGVSYHKVCSTSIGNNDSVVAGRAEKTHVIFGDDIDCMKNWHRDFKLGKIFANTLTFNICDQILRPIANRAKALYRNDRIQLLLHTDLIGGDYKLNGITIVNEDGEIVDTLPPSYSKSKTQRLFDLQRLKEEADWHEGQELFDDYLVERSAEEEDRRQRESLSNSEPDLLSDDEFYDRDDDAEAKEILADILPKPVRYIQGLLF